MIRTARGTRPNPIIARAMIILEARCAAARGDHARASELYASIGRLYVVEINIPEEQR